MSKFPEIPALFGVWLGDYWMLLGGEDGCDTYDMPHVFFSRQNAQDWLMIRPNFSDGLVVPMNAQALSQETLSDV